MSARVERGVESGMRVLVTGATGYIGGRLIPRLLDIHAVIFSAVAREAEAAAATLPAPSDIQSGAGP